MLHLPPAASLQQIQTAYRTLVLRHHPDVGGEHERMVALSLAYELASSAAKTRSAKACRREVTITNSHAHGPWRRLLLLQQIW